MSNVVDAHVVEPGTRADGPRGAVDVGQVRARLRAGNDPRLPACAAELSDGERPGGPRLTRIVVDHTLRTQKRMSPC